MDLDNKEDLRLVDHLKKCRCCFEKFDHIGNQVQITDFIEEQFLELTQIELKSSPTYSNMVCMKCTNELQSISNFRSVLITKQLQLYDFVTTSEYKFQDAVKFEPVFIKIETQSTDELDNIFKFESQYEEIENYEVPVSQQLKTIDSEKLKSKMINKKLKVKVSKAVRRVILKEKRFFCDSCNFGSTSKSDIAKHVLTHLPKLFRKLTCDQCEFVTISDQVMRSHKRMYHGHENENIIICHCGKRFSNESIYNKHTQQKHNKKPKVKKKSNKIKKICPHCGIMISTNLSLHIRCVHLKEKRFFCDLCEFRSFKRCTIVEHVLTHLSLEFREKLHCSKCDYETISPQKFKTHVRSYCKDIKENSDFVCHCGKMFGSKAVLNNHISYTHKPKKEYKCTICGKFYSSALILKEHMANHTGKRDVTCEVCGKKFVTLRHLTQHSIYHKDRKFVCTFEGCTKKFFRSNRLESHKKTHIGQRDFACHLCDKKYYDNSALNDHMSNVHKQFKYICEVPGCSSKFARIIHYRNHLFSHHKDLSHEKLEILLKKMNEIKQVCNDQSIIK